METDSRPDRRRTARPRTRGRSEVPSRHGGRRPRTERVARRRGPAPCRAELRRHGQARRGDPRRARPALARREHPGHPICGPHPEAVAGIRHRGRAHAGSRHRRECRHLQRRQRRAVRAASLRQQRSAGAHQPGGAAGEPVEPRRVGTGVLRLPRSVAQHRGRWPGGVPPDEFRSAPPRRSRSRGDRCRVPQLLRCPRHPSCSRPDLRRRRRR